MDNELIDLLKSISLKLDSLVDTEAGTRQVTASLEKFTAFTWHVSGLKQALVGIAEPDPVRFEELLGIQSVITALKRNTEQFLMGYPANNVLLWGARGTGKSSCIKALHATYHHRGLRLIEVDRDDLVNIHMLTPVLRNRKERFIIFCDDLSYVNDEFRRLKTVIEGGLQRRPNNVLFYATSNRRHLVPETFSENAPIKDEDGELHPGDTLQEKTSFSDRFGLKIGFNLFTPETYMDVIRYQLKARGIEIEEKIVFEQAMRWSIKHGGYSGRTAVQFVDDLEGRWRL
ncbi:MAG: ATP-binding protein [Nitrospirae bacterium]|nr:ATP-binding protein [Nitrospirota bacterium]